MSGAPVPPPLDKAAARLDAKIAGLREARRLLADAQHITRWGWWRGRESSRHALHAIASAREKIGRDLKKLRTEREAIGAAVASRGCACDRPDLDDGSLFEQTAERGRP